MQLSDSQRRSIKTALLLAVVLIGAGAILSVAGFKVVMNSTPSLPGYVYLVDTKAIPKVGELIAFIPPKNPFLNSAGFLKIVGGVEGDIVSVDGQRFYVNGKYIGESKSESIKGQPLLPGPTGVICRGCFFVYTTHKDSFDSRYKDIGWIDLQSVIGRAYRIF